MPVSVWNGTQLVSASQVSGSDGAALIPASAAPFIDSGDPVTETRGYPLAGTVQTTTNAFGNAQTTTVWTPVDLTVSSVQWRVYRAADYEFQLDGVSLATRTLAASSWGTVYDAGTFTVSAGVHTFKLTKISGSTGHAFRGHSSRCDGWLHVAHWQEAGGAEIPLIRVTADLDAAAYTLIDPPPPTNSADFQWGEVVWDQTFHADRTVAGVLLSADPDTTYEILRDGQVIGTSPALMGSTITETWPESAVWIALTTPTLFAADTIYEMTFRRADLGTFPETRYSLDAPYTDANQTVGQWQGAAAGTMISARWVIAD